MRAEHSGKFGVLPNIWLIRKVGALCRVGTGGTPNTKFPEYYEPATVGWIKSGDVKGTYITSAEHKISEAGMKNSAAIPHPRGTVLMAMSGRGKTRGTTAILKIEAACSQSVAAIIPGRDVTPEFLHFQFVKRYQEIRAITGNDDRSGLNMSLIRNIDLIVPPLAEQQKIGGVLGVVQRAMEQQGRLLAMAAQLKKALLQQLFTQGLRGEAHKETDFGPVPESWEVVRLSELFGIKHGYAFDGEFFKEAGEYILLTPGHFFEEGGFRDQREKTKYYTGEIPDGYVLHGGDLLVAMTEQKAGLLGSSLIVPESGKFVHNQRLGLIVDLNTDHLDKLYLFYLFNTERARREIAKTSSGSKVRHTSPGKILDLRAGLPSLTEQREIAETLRAVDSRIEVAKRKRTALTDLFRTLLHQLMTAEIRVHDIDV